MPEPLDEETLAGARSLDEALAAAGGPVAALSANLGALVLVLVQVDYDAQDRPVMVSREHHLADAFEMTVYRRGPAR